MENIRNDLYLPTQIVSGDIENFSAQSYKLVNFISNYRETFPESDNRSNEGGWQSKDKYIHENSDFSPWVDLIKQELRDLIPYYHIFNDIYIREMWININPKNTYNQTHIHPHADLAGVLWIKIPPKSGDFYFVLPNHYFNSNLIRSTELSYRKEIGLHPGMVEHPAEGKMMIFPANLPHRVALNESDEERISISFNLGIQPWE